MTNHQDESGSGLRELAKAAASLPWALSLFGVHQAASVMKSRSRDSHSDEMSSGFDAVTSSIVEQFSENLKTTFDTGDRVQRQIIDTVMGFVVPQSRSATTSVPGQFTQMAPIFTAQSQANEEVLICYTRGQGRFSDDRRFIALNNQIYLLDGREFGLHQGVWEAAFTSPQELLKKPDPPSPPLNEPLGPVQKGIISAQRKAVWSFLDGTLYSVGPSVGHLVPLNDGGNLFLVSSAQVVTNGTGRFDGVYGLTQSLGSTYVPRGIDLFGGENKPFPSLTIDTFKLRIVKNHRPIPSTARPVVIPPAPFAAQDSPSTTSPDSQFLSVLGSRMHYVDMGTGNPLLFLHGNPVWSYLWRNIIPTISRSCRCIAPDLIGMGKSDHPEIEYSFTDHVKYLDEFIEALGLKNVTMVLHDWGCILGFYHAMRNARNIRGLIFMEATFRPFRTWDDFPEPLRETFQAFRTPDIGFEKIVVNNEFIEQLLPRSMFRKLSEPEMDMYRLPFRNPSHRKVIWKFANALPIAGQPIDVTKAVADYSSWLKSTEIPKLLLYGEPGAITSSKDVSWAQEHLNNLKTASVGKGLHFLQEDNPEAICDEIIKWLPTFITPKAARD